MDYTKEKAWPFFENRLAVAAKRGIGKHDVVFLYFDENGASMSTIRALSAWLYTGVLVEVMAFRRDEVPDFTCLLGKSVSRDEALSWTVSKE